MADLEKATKWAEAVGELLRGLSAAEALSRLNAKLMDLVRRGELKDLAEADAVRKVFDLVKPVTAGYSEKVFRSYDELVSLANTMYRDMGPDVARNLPKIEAIERVAAARWGSYSKGMSKKIARTLRRNLAAGNNETQITRELTNKTNLGKTVAETLGRTSVNGYGTALKMEKARLADVVYFEYVGFRRENTRHFCLEMIGQTVHIDDIRKMRNGQIEPVQTYMGGYNCHHHWEPDPFANKGSSGQNVTRTVDGKSITFFQASRAAGVSQAEAKLRDKLGIDNVDLGRMDEKIAPFVADALTEISGKYEYDIRGVNMEERRYYAAYYPKTRIIKFNRDYFEDREKIVKIMAEDIANGVHPDIPRSQIVRFCVMHEFSHSIHNEWTGSKEITREIRKIMDNTRATLAGADEETRKKLKISTYAMQDEDEFLAESFGHYYCSEKVSPFAVQVVNLLKNHFSKGRTP